MQNYIKEKNNLSNLISFTSHVYFLQDVDMFLLENTD